MKICVDVYEGIDPASMKKIWMIIGRVIEVQSFVLWPGGRPVFLRGKKKKAAGFRTELVGKKLRGMKIVAW
jgi:hypothetical protein